MANVTAGYSWTSGEVVTPTKLNSAAAPTVVVADNEVTTGKILDGAVTNAKLATGIDASKLTTGTLAADRIGSSAITTARIADDAVTNDKLSLAANAGEIKKALNADNPPPIFACRAWVNFDATRDSSGASNTSNTNRFIRASGNVSSVLKTATGVFTITFTTAMPDENYAMCGFANWSTSNPAGIVGQNNTLAPAAESCVIRVFGSTTAAENNVSHNHVMFFR
jgi:hypothetical protein